MIARARRGRISPRAPRLARPLLSRRARRALAALAVLAATLAGAWLWLRDSSLVAVSRVTITGVTGPDAGQIRSALLAAARNMTTLDVRVDELRMVVAPYAVVKDLRVHAQFPHGMSIDVVEQLPVGAVSAAGRTIAVAADGTLLRDTSVSSLPLIPVRVLPGGSRLSDPTALAAVGLLASAPDQLLSKLSQVTTLSGHGLVAQLAGGPSIYFGDTSRLSAKWIAAAAVLADAGSAGAAYIDVTDPQRPVAGAGTTSAGAATPATSTPATSTSATSTSAASTPGTSTPGAATPSAATPTAATATAATATGAGAPASGG